MVLSQKKAEKIRKMCKAREKIWNVKIRKHEERKPINKIKIHKKCTAT